MTLSVDSQVGWFAVIGKFGEFSHVFRGDFYVSGFVHNLYCGSNLMVASKISLILLDAEAGIMKVLEKE